MKSVLAFTLGATHPSSRLRIAAYADSLRLLGWQLRLHHFDSGMGEARPRSRFRGERAVHRLRRGLQTVRAMAALRKLPPHEPIIISRELPVSRRPFLRARNPLVLDVDDALYLGQGRERLHELCRRAQVVVCGNETIAGELAGVARRCVVIPTVVDTGKYALRTDYGLNGPLRLGWMGSSMSIEQTLMPWLKVLAEIRRQLPFHLVVVSDQLPALLRELDWVRFLKWSPAVESAIASHLDVGIMPLQDDAFQRAKCGAKLVQYMAAGLPVIATPVGVNRELVLDGTTGFWAADSAAWGRAIIQLAGQEPLRAAMGRAGHEHVRQNYSVARWAGHWAALLDEL